MKKKSQSSIEFIVIFSFVLLIIFIFSIISSHYLIKISSQKHKKQRDEFANSILFEIRLLNSVEKGYKREIEINKEQLNKFNISIDFPYLVITDLLEDPKGNAKYYYEIPGKVAPKIYYNQTINKTILIFEK